MTLSNEQCIEIAEKVWGLSLLDLAQLRFDEGGYAPPESLEYIENYTTQLVNSWKGFGRTVEAMADMPCEFSRGFVFSADGIEVEFSRCVGQKGKEGGYAPTFQSGIHMYIDVSIIEATHLAALEAVKEKE